MTVDTHLHLWDLDSGRYAWLSPASGLIYRTFSPADARSMLSSCGMEQAVLVQAEDSIAETLSMLDVAQANPWITGVVGWIPLDGAESTIRALDAVADHPSAATLRGVRSGRHADPTGHPLLAGGTLASARVLAHAGLVLDIPDAWPRVLGDATSLAHRVTSLTVVLDHLGQPPVGDRTPRWQRWHDEVARFAALPNTVAKVSGLSTCLQPGVAWSIAAVRPTWDAALQLFGPQRLMLGSDWPICLRGAGSERYFAVLGELLDELTEDECAAVACTNAQRVYGRPS